MCRSNYRQGMTLAEVLIAIFVMSIGLLSLLTLFPLAGLNVAQAVRDNRCAQLASNAEALFRAGRWHHDPAVIEGLLNPHPGVWPDLTGSTGPSYPVLVDPIGHLAHSGVISRRWLADQVGTVPRRGISTLNQADAVNSRCLLADDIHFTHGGQADTTMTGSVLREGRFSWAALIRRPRCTLTPVDLTILVYQGRGVDWPTPERAYSAVLTAGSTTATVMFASAADRPLIRRGQWVFDATMVPSPRAYFYRVIDWRDTSPNELMLELQTPIRSGSNPGTLVVLDQLVEVFQKGPVGP